jgi:hypothetical protein
MCDIVRDNEEVCAELPYFPSVAFRMLGVLGAVQCQTLHSLA